MRETTWRQALEKTRRTTFGRIAQFLGNSEITDDFWVEMESLLIQADIGLHTTQRLLENLARIAQQAGFTRGEQVHAALTELLQAELHESSLPSALKGPSVTILVGVNGSGKTTSSAKLGHWLSQQGMKVLLAAADTYRAAAAEQLSIWGDRLGVEVIKAQPGSDPGAVVFNACQAAVSRACDHLIVDTSGRMHTEHNLMAELQKIARVCGKVIEGAPHALLLVLDASTGQNGLAQAQAFTEAVPLDGAILAKLDGSAKGGMVVAIYEALKLPVLFVGVGENLSDFTPFDPQAYVANLLDMH